MNITISGLTIQRGNATTGGGGGIFLRHNAIIQNCIFKNNTVRTINVGGGAILIQFLKFSSPFFGPQIINCTFVDNKSEYVRNPKKINSYIVQDGGAIVVSVYGGSINNCTFLNNRAGRDGGAISLDSAVAFFGGYMSNLYAKG